MIFVAGRRKKPGFHLRKLINEETRRNAKIRLEKYKAKRSGTGIMAIVCEQSTESQWAFKPFAILVNAVV